MIRTSIYRLYKENILENDRHGLKTQTIPRF